jgi:hypothetical protein
MRDDDFGVGNSEVRNFAYHLTKAENEFFKEELYKANSVIRIKRKYSKKNGEEWQIMQDGKIALTLKESRFTIAERSFLHTVDGMQFLINSFKSGLFSVSKIKEAIKEILNRKK